MNSLSELDFMSELESTAAADDDKQDDDFQQSGDICEQQPFERTITKPVKREIVWSMVVKLAVFHIFGISAFFLAPFTANYTILFGALLVLSNIFGIQIGAHRLWSHKSFQATFGLRLFLAACQTMAMQNSIYDWVRDHRVHHKWSDTDADPHNATRGFFFSHMGWLMVRKHPEVMLKGATVDMKDLNADPIVTFQHRHYGPLVLLLNAIIPTLIPVLLWKEHALIAFLNCVLYRYLFTFHVTLMTNSWAHMYGTKPYNRKLAPVEASTRHLMFGEGFHNYHHAFPWDYSASELGPLDVFNPATALIDCFAHLGWASNLKKPTAALVKRTIQSNGDFSLGYSKGHGAWDWFWGLASTTLPFTSQFAYKYAFLYLFTRYNQKCTF